MPDRKRLDSMLLLTSVLALLASVLFAPIRTSGFVTVSSRPDCLRRNFALPPCQTATRLSAASATDAVQEVNALASENEERDRADARDELLVSFLIPSSFRKFPARQLLAPLTIPSVYPLRC